MIVNRLTYLDKAKGLAIILMVFAHTTPGDTISTWIFAFHMPLFFIVSGVLIELKLGERSESTISLKEGIQKRLFQLGVPYCVFSLLLVAYYGILQYLAGEKSQVGHNLIKVVTMQGIDSLWFLPCYFFAEITMRFTLCRLQWTHKIGVMMICTLCLYFLFVQEVPREWWWRLGLKIIVCYSFVYIGYELMRNHVWDRMHLMTACVILFFCSGLALYNGFSAIGSLQLNNPFLFIVNATGLTLVWFCFFRKGDGSKWFDFLTFFGRNSMVVLCTNNLLIEMIRLLDYRLTNGILLANGLLGSIFFTVLIIGIEIPIIRLATSTRTSFLFGKRKNNL